MNYFVIVAILVGILIIGMIFAGTSYSRLMRAYNKFDNALTYSNLNGFEFAKFAIPKLGLDTKISFTDRQLGDFYSPKNDTIVISTRSAENRSVASVCITAHELGHAVQKKNKSALYILQRIVAWLTIISKFLFFPVIIAGIILLFFNQYFDVGKVLILVALGSLIFSYILKIVTIPVEYNASKIAFDFLKKTHVLEDGELKAAKKMLNVAASTYIASLFAGFLNFFRAIGRSFKR